MRYKIKHISLPLMIGLACATSCSSDPDFNSEKGGELKFEVAESFTRATAVTTTSNITRLPFMLFGDVFRDGEFHSGLRTIFEKDSVSYTGGRWDYGAKQYWNMGQEHSFVAIHPYVIPGMKNLKYENSKVSFTYEMPEEDSDSIFQATSTSVVKDIIVATHRRKYNRDNSGPVKFNFQHILSRINVAPALSQDAHMYPADDESKTDIEFGFDLIRNEYIQIRKVELIGFYTKADFSFKPSSFSTDPDQTDDRELTRYVYENSSKTISFYIPDKDSPHIFNDGKNVCVLDTAAALMMIPQKFADNAQIKLEYAVNTDNIDPVQLRYVIVPLKGKELEPGKSYTMKFTITDVYKGQIDESSLKIELNDTNIPDSKFRLDWINYDDEIEGSDSVIRQEFDYW